MNSHIFYLQSVIYPFHLSFQAIIGMNLFGNIKYQEYIPVCMYGIITVTKLNIYKIIIIIIKQLSDIRIIAIHQCPLSSCQKLE